jgi:hypothetical protein
MIKYLFSDNHEVNLNYGESTQLQPGNLLLAHENNRNLKPTRSQSFSLSYHFRFCANTFKTEFYYQKFDFVPVNTVRHFSAFNYFNEALNFELESAGKGKVFGVDLTFEKHFKGFYFIPSLSIYNSSYSFGSNLFYNGRFNTNYNSVFTGGKEFRLKDGRKYISADCRVISRNGYMEPANSDIVNQYVYSSRLPSYFRIDLRISYRKNRERSTVIWALDIQNASNNKNISSHYFDTFTKKTETRYQLGLIPVLSYKILF